MCLSLIVYLWENNYEISSINLMRTGPVAGENDTRRFN